VTETPVWPEDPGWRVRSGAGLVSQMAGQGLFSAEEEERQRRAAEREAEADAGAQQLRDEQAAEAAAERAFEMARQGYTPRTPGEFLAAIAAEDARREAVRQRRIEKGLPVADGGYQPDPVFEQERPRRPTKWEVEARVAASKAEREATPATQADLRRLEGEVAHAKALAHAAKTGNSSQRRSAVVQPHDDGLRYRHVGDAIIGGPY